SSSPSYTAPSNANSFNITAGTATKLVFTNQPASGVSIQATGTGNFAAAVAVEDVNSNIETADGASTVTLGINNNPGSGVLTCSSSASIMVLDCIWNVETAGTATTVTLRIGDNPGSRALTCSSIGVFTVTASSGVAAFSGCAITKAGSGYTLTAASSPSSTPP